MDVSWLGVELLSFEFFVVIEETIVRGSITGYEGIHICRSTRFDETDGNCLSVVVGLSGGVLSREVSAPRNAEPQTW